MKISNKVKTALAGGVGVVAMGLKALPVAAAGNVRCPDGSEAKDLTSCSDIDKSKQNLNNGDLMGTINTIINVIIGLIGFVAVVVIILGGFQYTTSAGDPGKVTKAKNTILYGIVGLVISLLAFAIVNFILGNVFK